MAGFPDFRDKHGAGRIAATPIVDGGLLQRYRDRLPAALLEEWQISGWAGFQRGFLWLTDPAALEPIVTRWRLDEPAICFARTAFGNLFVWDQAAVYCLFVHEGTRVRLVNDLGLFFELSLCDDDVLEDVLDMSLFDEVLASVGPVAADEMYTFVPALVLGGAKSIGHTRKVQMAEQLLLLSQLTHG